MARLFHHIDPVRALARAACVALVAACALAPGAALAHEQAGDVEWSQFQGGPGHPGAILEAPAPPYRERWRFRPSAGGISGAVLTGELAVAVGRDAVYGIDVASGEQAFEIPRQGGPISTPALGTVGDRLVLLYLEGPPRGVPGQSPSPSPEAGTGGTRASELVAVDLADRSELWRARLDATSRSGVSVAEDLAYVGDDLGGVYAFSVDTGALVWKAEAVGRVDSPPAVADGRVYVAARNLDQRRAQVLALDARSGERRWTFSPAGGALVVSALSAGDGAVVLGAGDQLVRGLSGEDGSLRWHALALNLFSPASAPAYQPGNVYIADAAGGLYRLNPADGRRDWDHQTNALIVQSSPVVVGPYVVVGLGDGRLAAFDATSGDLVYESGMAPGPIGPLALSHEVLVAPTGGSQAALVAYEHDPEGVLVRVASPTIPVPPRLVGWFALAAAIVGVAVLVPFRLLAPRFGPAFTREGSVEAEP